MTPWQHQQEANDALDRYLAESDGNPCIEIPTGGGKTFTMALANRRYVESWPATRIMVVAHIKELLEQGASKMKEVWPQAPIGIYSAGMGYKDVGYSITYAGIQSIYDKASIFGHVDIIHVDECHRIPLKDAGQYRRFINDAKAINPRLRVVGWTATPYRLDGGKICHKDFVLSEIIYRTSVKTLIDAGHLCKLRTKLGRHTVNVTGVGKSGGDYNKKQLAAAAEPDESVAGIAKELAEIVEAEQRNHIIVFCVSVDHAEKMSAALAFHGIDAPTIHEGTTDQDRASRAALFKQGKLRALVNVNVLSEGFDAQRVDCVAMVRPTQSKGLYYQQVGRGLRIHPTKADCLILDFAGNILRHGPIDTLAGHKVIDTTCENCMERFAYILGKCTACGWEIPKPKAEELAAAEKSPRIIPSNPKDRVEAPIISDGKPWEMPVKSVSVKIHHKDGKPPTLCVTYHGQIQDFREWICLEHSGFPANKARAWWAQRFVGAIPKTVAEAIAGNMFLEAAIAEKTEAIMVKQNGKYLEVCGYKFRGKAVGAIAG